MRISISALVLVAALGPIVAHADVKQDLTAKLQSLPGDDKLTEFPKFAISNNMIHVGWTKGNVHDLLPGTPGDGTAKLEKVVVTVSDDQKVAWIAAEIRGVRGKNDCTPAPCAPITLPPAHATALLEKVGDTWRWVAWHISDPTTIGEQRQALQDGTAPDVIARSVSGAEDVAAVFETTLVDPKALAASVSSRKDVVLYGSAAAERYVGAKVKAQLAAWKLAFRVRDGVQAGLVGSSNVAWVAANVDAMSLARPKAKPTPYRILAIYEKTGGTWSLVQIHFSVDVWTWSGKTK